MIEYKQSGDYTERQQMIHKLWNERLLGCQRNVEIWPKFLALRALVLSPLEDKDMWIKFASLVSKQLNKQHLYIARLHLLYIPFIYLFIH